MSSNRNLKPDHLTVLTTNSETLLLLTTQKNSAEYFWQLTGIPGRWLIRIDERKNEPIDGANDGGSGVGVLLEIARNLQTYEPDVGIDIILFDGEDNGADNDYTGSNYAEHNGWCLGSQHWSRNKHERNYFAYYGILLDMVGAKDSRFLRELESMKFAPMVVKKIWDKGNQLGHGEFFLYKDGGSILDDHIFVYNWGNIQMIDIIDYDPETYFGSYHHTHDDNMDIIDTKTLNAVGETVTHVIYSERSPS